jgi:hypothetical protein
MAGLDDDWTEPLEYLRFHWDTAYAISCLGAGRWLAQRRDNRQTLRADTPYGLRDLIIQDYQAQPVAYDSRVSS